MGWSSGWAPARPPRGSSARWRSASWTSWAYRPRKRLPISPPGWGIRLGELGETKGIDLTVDGADEIGPGLSLIKGGGAALLREKLVWEASRSCVVIADAAKNLKVLGKFPLPIEVVAFGHKTTANRICDALAECDLDIVPVLRRKDGEPVRTDGGNLIYDAHCGRIEEPAALAAALKSVTGVVDHGLFLDLADRALIGTPDGVLELEP